MNCVAIKLCGKSYRLESKFHNSPPTAAKRHYPLTATRSFPVRGEGGLPSDVPALLQVVVDEVLQQELIHTGTTARSGYRPHIVDQHAQGPMARLHQRNSSGP